MSSPTAPAVEAAAEQPTAPAGTDSAEPPSSEPPPAPDAAALLPGAPARADAGGPSHPGQPGQDGASPARRLAILTLTALGVVYGDIGTSPLYALKECFSPHYGLAPTPANVLGILSLILWALLLVVGVKYLAFIMRAHNRGEGGILALLALVLQLFRRPQYRAARVTVTVLGLFGAALLYGDGIITPAISVLSAMEGLVVAEPRFESFVIPGTLLVLLTLFAVQRRGTAGIGAVFGPIVLVWFGTLAVLGGAEVLRSPAVLAAANPMHGLRFFADHGTAGFLVLGSVVLAITGAEALYADMGHFGRRPIQLAWVGLVFPALILNYLGQGALLLREPAAAANPFYLLAPRWFLYPLIAIATLATIVASQALISGAFSLTRQAVQLGFVPRVRIIHTSRSEHGQVYVPEVNTAMMLGCLLLVVAFGSSSALGAAYGIAVTGTMVITSLLFGVVAAVRWRWPLPVVLALVGAFLVVDVAFLAANVVKIADGGWVPLAAGGALFLLMLTWKQGRDIVRAQLERAQLPLDVLLDDLRRRPLARVPGTAVFMTSTASGAPVVLLHHLKHNKVLHEQVVLLSVLGADVPEVPEAGRLSVEPLGEGFWRVRARYGFMETPNAPDVLRRCESAGLRTTPMTTSYYLGRERLTPTGSARMAGWRKRLFMRMSQNARSATDFFGLPPNRVVELGAVIEL